MSDVNQLIEEKKEDLFATQQEQINENQQLQQGNVTIEQQKEKEDVLNTALIISAPKLKTKKNPKLKPEKVEEKQKVEEKHEDAIKFDKSFAEVRGDDSSDMAAIRKAMKEYFDTRETYEKESAKSTDAGDEAYGKMEDKLREVEAMCNRFLRFRISFSKAAREKTAQVKQLRLQVQTKLAELKPLELQQEAQKESKVKRGFKRFGDSIKRFFTERIPDGFKGAGRTIKHSFNNTFKTRTAGQFFKDAVRDYIWGGIFRNAFNLVAGVAILPIWLTFKTLSITGNAINALKGKQVVDTSKFKCGIPHPHLPSTWTAYHEEMAHEKERVKRREEEAKKAEESQDGVEYVVDEHRLDKGLATHFILFGPSLESNLYNKGTAKYKTGVGYTNKQTRDSIIERAKAEYNTSESWRNGNIEDDEEDED